jgi:hypothetical protein
MQRPEVRLSCALTHEWMSQECVDDDGRADRAWEEPKRPFGEFFPQRQTLSVVDIKGDQQQDVGKAHSGDMLPDPTMPAAARSPACPMRGCQSERAENEEVIVLHPAHRGQRCGGHKDSYQTPVVDRAEVGMLAARFSAQHRDDAGHRAGKSKQDVDGNEREKDQRGGRDRDARDDRDVISNGTKSNLAQPQRA